MIKGVIKWLARKYDVIEVREVERRVVETRFVNRWLTTGTIQGDITIDGNLQVNGNLVVTGGITCYKEGGKE